MNRYDIVAIGENLIDLLLLPENSTGTLILEGNPGGAPANVLAGAAKLKLKTAFISKLSNDRFGRYILSEIENAGIDTCGIIQTSMYPTTLAVVSLDEHHDRSFSFYRDQTADTMLSTHEVDCRLIENARIFHFGSVSMTKEPARQATLAAAQFAKEQGVLVSYDPNLRELLWNSQLEAREILLKGLKMADIVKLSIEELEFLSGENDASIGIDRLMEQYPIKMLAVTQGAKGCIFRCNGKTFHSCAYDLPVLDTTGAGDAFMAAMLYKVLTGSKPVEEHSDTDIQSMLDFANAAGSLATTKHGAIRAMPTLSEIQTCMDLVPRC